MSIYIPKGPPKEGQASTWASSDFDQAAFDQTEAGRNVLKMRQLFKNYPDDEMHPDVLKYWEEHGVRKELFDADVDDGIGKYAVFTPLDMDSSKRYALVYDSHGGMLPINGHECAGFPMLAAAAKYICVLPNNRGPSNDGVQFEFPRILNELVRKGYPIDQSRVYAVGYSSGSDATGVLACGWPELIAAISPDPGGNLFAKGKWYAHPEFYAKNLDLALPIICVGGTMDGGDKYPFTAPHHFENFNIWMQTIVKVANYTPLTLEQSRAIQAGADRARQIFGFDFHRTFTAHMEGIDWHCGDFLDADCVTRARFISGEGLPHVQTGYHAAIVWDFVKHFSRDTSTGASIYSPLVIDGIR